MSVTCKVFSATMVADREKLGEKVTEWLHSHHGIYNMEVTQSSDSAFHCVAITLFGDPPGDGGHVIYKDRAWRTIAVFSATKAKERDVLGDRVAEYCKARKLNRDDMEIIVRQSSDSEFHCLTIVVLS